MPINCTVKGICTFNSPVNCINYGHSELSITNTDNIHKTGFIIYDNKEYNNNLFIPFMILSNVNTNKITFQVGNEYIRDYSSVDDFNKLFYTGKTIELDDIFLIDLLDILDQEKTVMITPVDKRSWFSPKLKYEDCSIDCRYFYELNLQEGNCIVKNGFIYFTNKYSILEDILF